MFTCPLGRRNSSPIFHLPLSSTAACSRLSPGFPSGRSRKCTAFQVSLHICYQSRLVCFLFGSLGHKVLREAVKFNSCFAFQREESATCNDCWGIRAELTLRCSSIVCAVALCWRRAATHGSLGDVPTAPDHTLPLPYDLHSQLSTDTGGKRKLGARPNERAANSGSLSGTRVGPLARSPDRPWSHQSAARRQRWFRGRGWFASVRSTPCAPFCSKDSQVNSLAPRPLLRPLESASHARYRTPVAALGRVHKTKVESVSDGELQPTIRRRWCKC